ncbi:MAG: V-type ATPase subunit [Candidatus Altiarchaeota archaeon]|nr:V-type ATPase subunit [Candidatus Altiarchaeota archaeon]
MGSELANAYVLGLVSGLQSKNLTKKDYAQLIESKDLREVLSYLDSTQYRQVARTNPAGGVKAFDEAISAAFQKAYGEATSYLPEADQQMLQTLFKGMWDLQNIKAIARSIYLKNQGMPTMAFFGALSHKTLDEALKAQDLRDFGKNLPEDYSTMVLKASDSKTLFEFEEKLEKQFLNMMLSKTKSDVKDYVNTLVDSLNIRVYLICKLNEVDDIAPHTMAGGYHLSGILDKLIREDIQSFIKGLANTPYQKAVSQAAEGGDMSHIHLLDAGLAKAIVDDVKYRSMLHPLSLNTVIYYLKTKEIEALNVRSIIFGKAYQLSNEDISGLIS